MNKMDGTGNSKQNQKRDFSMADVTVRHLADMVGIPVDKLIRQMNDAGLAHKASDDNVSDDEKHKLLAFLKKSHGSEASEGKKNKLH